MSVDIYSKTVDCPYCEDSWSICFKYHIKDLIDLYKGKGHSVAWQKFYLNNQKS